MVKTISRFEITYAVEAETSREAEEYVIGNLDTIIEYDQQHIGEFLHDAKFVVEGEFTHSYLDPYKLLNKVPKPIELDPTDREWEYSGCGNKVWKGTSRTYNES